ncbi:MAG: HigA family addiction module antidote protein [Magnetococcales bacterium]|nr:HigA family addiction module antidote protein [Magnetococcales bacterium]
MLNARPRLRKPTHPGGLLKRHHMDPLGLTVTELAHRVGVSRKTISKIVNENGAITADMALRLAMAFNTTPELWLNLQNAVDIWEARQSEEWKKVQPIPQEPRLPTTR